MVLLPSMEVFELSTTIDISSEAYMIIIGAIIAIGYKKIHGACIININTPISEITLKNDN
jgi:hypothetical protein